MKSSLGLRLGQSLTMTPALQQAIRLLQLSSLDLQQEIEQALDSNLLLERDEGESAGEDTPAPEPAEAAAEQTAALELREDGDIPEEMPVDAAWDDVFDDLPAPARSGDDEELRDFLEANLRRSTGLHEHLLDQARVAPFDERQAQIAEFLIDAIDEEGYLRNWTELLAEIERALGAHTEEVEAVLCLVQEFDPIGVGARDLGECLRLQIEAMPARTPGAQTALRLVTEHLALVARRDVAALAKAADRPAEDIHQALTLIKALQPHPGRPFQSHESEYISPDVFVLKRNGRWTVSLNPEHMPRLRINSHYQGLIRRADTSRDQQMLKQHLQEARYFINSLEARNETLLRVAQSIVEEQRAFLDYGPEAMRPLVLRDIAEQLGIHESTVSRATANKYMLTPRGLFELKYFFSSHVQTTGGGVCSATAIQAMIKRLIAAEDPARPLSDATLSELLLKEGIQVARRTVAKYREGLGLPPSHERKPPA
ncbi:RNA polymerase factor sigma-54 [Fontimonas sp. SYSU GA230001]|uniref:RNA polymerase factor sigma-54 n=1 Tax=Fontimonas sp. SYSU GA230001 TaxID=3142450 RepID=UPI0032B5000A